MGLINWLNKLGDKIELAMNYEDSWDVAYCRKYLEKDAKNVGQTIEYFQGGAFSPMELWRFQYLGIKKGKKVFKQLHK